MIVAAASIGTAAAEQPTSTSTDPLPELIRVATENSPTLKQAVAEVAAATGAAFQAGLYPNPTVGYQGDQIGSGHTAGQQGGFLHQTIVTRDKLGLAQSAALAEVARTEAALQQARADLAADVRAGYFAIRASEEAVKIAEEMSSRADAVYERQKKLLDSGQAVAPHEVAQARSLAMTVRGELMQSRNRRTAAEKKLAATVGIHSLPAIESRLPEDALPECSFDALRDRVVNNHSELRSAAAQVERARFQLELAKVTPYPNVETQTYVQRDYQTQTPQFGVQVGVAIPVFDRNQGNIAQAEANLVRASNEADRVRQDLTRRLADAFERYSTGRRLVEQYRTEILPNQRKASEGLAKRFEQEPGKVSFTEVVLTQQTLANTYTSYLNVLSAAWQAAADLTRLTQSDDWCEQVSGGSTPATNTWPDPSSPRK